MINERLLGVQDAAQIKAEYVQLLDQVHALALQAHKERRRYRQRLVSGSLGGGLVGVDRVGFANGFGKKTQAALFHFHLGDAHGASNQTLVCHFTSLLLVG
ncbi:hypothetical protein D3C84_1039600 [compost metagenome]